MYKTGMYANNIVGILMALLIIALGIIFLVVYDQIMKVKNELSGESQTVDDQVNQIELMALITGIIAVVVGGLLLLGHIGFSIISMQNGKLTFFKRTSRRKSGRRSSKRRSRRGSRR